MRTFAPSAHNVLSWVAPLVLGALLVLANALLNPAPTTGVGLHPEPVGDQQPAGVLRPESIQSQHEARPNQEEISSDGGPAEALLIPISATFARGMPNYRKSTVTNPIFTITPTITNAATTIPV